MRYELYGIYSKETGHNCQLGSYPSRRKALAAINTHAEKRIFEGYFILEKARMNAYPYGYDFFDSIGTCYRSGIMAAALKPAFWQSQAEYTAFNNRSNTGE